MSNFNEYRFKNFKVGEKSNKYLSIDSRINTTEDKVIVRFAENQVFETPYGYGLRLDHDKGIWLKQWQVSKVWDEEIGFVMEIVLDKKFTKVVDFKEDEDTAGDYDYDNIWKSMMEVAEEQSKTPVIWAK